MTAKETRFPAATRVVDGPQPDNATIIARHDVITGRRRSHGTHDRLMPAELRHRVIEPSRETVDFNRSSNDHRERPRPRQQAGRDGCVPPVRGGRRPLHGRVIGFLLFGVTVPLGQPLLLPRPARENGRRQTGDADQHRSRHWQAVTACEPPRPLGHRCRTGMHRLAHQPPRKLSLQLLRGRIAIGRLFLQALQGDRGEPPNVCRIHAGFSTQSSADSRDGWRLLLADDPRHHHDRLAAHIIGKVTGEELVQHQTKRIHIGRRGDP